MTQCGIEWMTPSANADGTDLLPKSRKPLLTQRFSGLLSNLKFQSLKHRLLNFLEHLFSFQRLQEPKSSLSTQRQCKARGAGNRIQDRPVDRLPPEFSEDRSMSQ